jgi:hypothetical protein
MAKKDLMVKMTHFLGWVLFILSLCIVIAGLIANKGEAFEFQLIGSFAAMGAFGFFLTRYKRGKKAGLSEKKEEKLPKKQIKVVKEAPISTKNEEKTEEKAKIIMDVKKKNILQTVGDINDQQVRIDTLERLIAAYEKSYYNGEAEISDEEFDRLLDELKALCPDSPVFARMQQEPIEDTAYRKVMEQHKPEKDIFRIEYVDAMGKESSRDIEIIRFEEENDRFYIFAYCHLRKETRQFLVDRISSISYGGRIVQNPRQFLWDMYTNSALYKTQKALNEHTDEILTLVFLARADGRMLKNEREVIGRYIDAVVPGFDAESVEKMLKKTACELAEFNKILKRSKSWSPDIKKLVMDAASQIFVLKKQSDSMEQATFAKLKVAIGRR